MTVEAEQLIRYVSPQVTGMNPVHSKPYIGCYYRWYHLHSITHFMPNTPTRLNC